MNRRRTRPSWFRIIILCLLVLGGAYINRFILPNQPQFGVPSPTPTRAPESFITEAEEYFRKGKLVAAIAAYQQAISSDPENPAVYVALARVQVWAGQYPQAQRSAEDALLLNPDNSMAHAVRAWALDFQGDFSGAEESITRALELDNQNALAYAYHVEILVDSYYNGTGAVDAIEKAAEASKIALTIAPDLLEAHRARAYIHEAVGEYEDAIREYEAALAINGNIALLHLSLGINYRKLEFYDKAIEEFTNANTLNPDDPNPDLYLSRTYATIGKYAQAMQYAETAVENSPADADLRGNLGVMYYYNAFYDKAIAELGYAVNGGFTKDGSQVEAISLSPNILRSAEYYYTYGRALSRTSKCSEALKISQLIFERVPEDVGAVENANAIISQCQQNLEQTPTPLLTSPEPATASPTGTMSAETPTPMPTP